MPWLSRQNGWPAPSASGPAGLLLGSATPQSIRKLELALPAGQVNVNPRPAVADCREVFKRPDRGPGAGGSHAPGAGRMATAPDQAA